MLPITKISLILSVFDYVCRCGVVSDNLRCVDAKKVWYEWCISSGLHTSALQNVGGRNYYIGL